MLKICLKYLEKCKGWIITCFVTEGSTLTNFELFYAYDISNIEYLFIQCLYAHLLWMHDIYKIACTSDS